MLFFFCWVTTGRATPGEGYAVACGAGFARYPSFFVGLHPTVVFFRWITPNCFVCYFWLDPKVTKRSRLNRPGYSGRRLRCRLRNSLRSNSAGSGRYAFTLRFTPVRLGLSQKAPLSLMIADTACFSFLFRWVASNYFFFSLGYTQLFCLLLLA